MARSDLWDGRRTAVRSRSRVDMDTHTEGKRIGSWDRIRTCDLAIMSRLLYH
jgi:hypothetical protein